MQKVVTKLNQAGKVFFKKLPTVNKLPFYTLSFTLAALIVTIIAVQQQQNIVQNAAEKCDDSGNSSASKETKKDSADNVNLGNANSGAIKRNPNANKKISGRFILKYKSGASKTSVATKVKKRNGKIKKRLERMRVDLVEVPSNVDGASLNELRNDPTVEYVYNDYYAYAGYSPNDTDFEELYALHNTGQTGGTENADVNAPQAWDKTKGDRSVRIAILDSGIDKNHPELKGKIVAEKNFFGGNNAQDDNGHGTHVAGTAAAIGGNSSGVIGMCPECSLLNGKVLDKNSSGPVFGIIEAINWAVENDADVINMSLGVSIERSELTPLEDAVNAAIDSGVVVVAIAGNCGDNNFQANHCDRKNKTIYPGGYEKVLTVSATDADDKKVSFSSTGSHVDVAAGGEDIYSTWPGGRYNTVSGTSQASPLVAGLAGLLIAQGNSGPQVVSKIQNTADKISGTGSSWKYGRVNAAKAVGSTTTEPEPTDTPDEPDATNTPKPTKEKQPTCKPVNDDDGKKDDNKDEDNKKNKRKNNNSLNSIKDNRSFYWSFRESVMCRIFPAQCTTKKR